MWESTATMAISRTKMTAGCGILFPTRSTVSSSFSIPVFCGAIGCTFSILALSAILLLPSIDLSTARSRAGSKKQPPAGTSVTGGSGDLLGRRLLQRLAQGFLVVLIQRRLKDLAFAGKLLQAIEHLVGGGSLEQHEKR